MSEETHSTPDREQRLAEAIAAFLERGERGEEADPRQAGLHDAEQAAALTELVEDARALEPWFAPLRAVIQQAGVGRVFGNYELLEVVAVGGQGVVYRARQVHVNKEVALKLVHAHDRHRSLRELEMAANLEHENLVRVYHVGEEAGRLYVTMRYAEKGSLDANLDEYQLPQEVAATAVERKAVAERKRKFAGLMAKVARAVHYLHEQGIIHRDLKPRNILLDARGEPLVADLGLARRIADAGPDRTGARDGDGAATLEGTVVGTPGYLSPEQAQGRTDLTAATDVYGLGAVLFKLLTRDRTPFMGTKEEILAQTADPEQAAPFPSAHNPNVGTCSDLELICRKCLVKEPTGRYADAAALADDLERCAREEETSVRRRGWVERALRGVVGAVNRKLSPPIGGIARWGAIDLWDAALNLLANTALYALIRTDQAPALLWLTQLAFVVVWWWMFLTYLFRHDRVEPTERSLALLWAGVTLANLTLFWIYCPPFGPGRAAALLAFYPPWAVVNGTAFLVVGRLYWGRYYLVGLLHFLVAVLMPPRPDLAPLVYGVFVAACMTWGALDNYRVARGQTGAFRR